MPSITVTNRGVSIAVAPGTCALQPLEAAGLVVPGCRRGICGRCKIRLVTGSPRCAVTPGISRAELDSNYALSCQLVVTENLRIEVI